MTVFAFEPTKKEISCDLTVPMFLDSYIELTRNGETPRILVCGLGYAETARELADKFHVDCILLPENIMPQDSWALASESKVIWSDGA